MPSLLSAKTDKYEYVKSKEILTSDQSRAIEEGAKKMSMEDN